MHQLSGTAVTPDPFNVEMNALNETQDKNVIKSEPYKRIEYNHNIFEKGKVTNDKRTKLENK